MLNYLRHLSSPTRNTAQAQGSENNESLPEEHTVQSAPFPLLNLPSEILDHILSFLPPVSLANVAQTCKALRQHASNDLFWQDFLRDSLPESQVGPGTFSGWKELYSSHHPYWFLPKHKIWFSDKTTLGNPLVGQLIIARYDYRLGSIEAYRLVAEHPDQDIFHHWSSNSSVIIHAFNPRVQLFLDDPVIKLQPEAYSSGNRLKQEVSLSRATGGRLDAIRSRIFPAISIPPHRQDSSMLLWPPSTIPSADRVRNESPTLFQDDAHKPRTCEEMSETTFRLRKWMVFGGVSERLGLRMAEDVVTWSTLPESCYQPSPEKPYQGIWVGDYAGHGCEFLVLIQKTPEEAAHIPPIRTLPDREDLNLMLTQGAGIVASGPNYFPPTGPSAISGDASAGTDASAPSSQPNPDPVPPGQTGRLEAIKLTGDPHVPRGEPSWIAEDIGPRGLLRVATDPRFSGARVVRSVGHVAERGFLADRYTPSELIMISTDVLAQYWIEMGHISYFKRVNIEAFLDPEADATVIATSSDDASDS